MKQIIWQAFAAALCCVVSASGYAEDKIMRIGIVGCDTSHVIAFTKQLNEPPADGSPQKFKVTVAYPGGSPDIPDSRNRVDGFVKDLKERGVEIVDSAEAVAEKADAILLESLDGRPHLAQFRAVAKGKPVFVDKPAAGSLADLLAIYQHAEATKTPCFSSSSLRYAEQVTALAADTSVGDLIGCETVGPLHIEEHHPDLFWYGIHGVEPLFTLMGTGCETVTRVDAEPSSLVVGKWRDGRIGSYRGLKEGAGNYAYTVYGTKGIASKQGYSGYGGLVDKICDFFVTGKPPVSQKDTIEIYAFMEAADESKRLGGQAVAISEVIARAEEAAKRGAAAPSAAKQ